MQTNNRDSSRNNQGSNSKAVSLIQALGVRSSSLNPFFDEGHKPVLDNKLGVTDRSELNKLEAALTPLTIQLALKRLEKQERIGLRQLQIAHSVIFGAIFPWAGQLRKTRITKNSEFAAPELIEGKVRRAFEKFYFLNAKDGKLENGLGKRSAAEVGTALALLYNDLNQAHPFQDGSGRSMRAVCTALARKIGYDLDWTRIADMKQTWDKASELAKIGVSTESLISLFQDTVVLLDAPAIPSPKPETSRRQIAKIVRKITPRV